MLLLLLTFLVIATAAAYAEPVTNDTKDKVSVLVLPARAIRTDAEAMNILKTEVYKKFNPAKYSVEIFGIDSSPALMEFFDKVQHDDKRSQESIRKEHYIEYGKDTNSTHVISIYIYPADMKFATGFFSYSVKYNVQADINIFNVPDNKYLLSKSYITDKKGDVKEGLGFVLGKLQTDFVVPPSIAK